MFVEYADLTDAKMEKIKTERDIAAKKLEISNNVIIETGKKYRSLSKEHKTLEKKHETLEKKHQTSEKVMVGGVATEIYSERLNKSLEEGIKRLSSFDFEEYAYMLEKDLLNI
jgi:hypothetical protein